MAELKAILEKNEASKNELTAAFDDAKSALGNLTKSGGRLDGLLEDAAKLIKPDEAQMAICLPKEIVGS